MNFLFQENRARVEEFQAGSRERVKGLSMSEAREVTADIRREANEFGKVTDFPSSIFLHDEMMHRKPPGLFQNEGF